MSERMRDIMAVIGYYSLVTCFAAILAVVSVGAAGLFL